jgi:hypothetical protein
MIAEKGGDCLGLGEALKMAGHRRRNRLKLPVTLFAATVATLSAMRPAFAGTPIAPSESEQRAPQQAREPDVDYNGEDFTRPESRIIVKLEGRTSGTTSETEKATLFLQGQVAFNLESDWELDLQVQLPVVSKSTTEENTVDTIHEFGLGDAEVQAALSRPINERWASGFGIRLITPSAEGTIGNGKWQILSGFGVRYSFLERGSNTFFAPKLRYALSIGDDPSERNISELQIAPTLSIGLPDRWFVLLYPSFDIRFNFGDPIPGQVGRLFLPIDVAVGRSLGDNFVMTLEVSAPVIKDFPVYELKAELKISATF